MTLSEFKEQIESFIFCSASDYARDVRYEITDKDDLAAHIHLKTYDDTEWIVPIEPNEEGEACISLGDNGLRDLTPGEFYAFLWFEAIEKFNCLFNEVREKQ